MSKEAETRQALFQVGDKVAWRHQTKREHFSDDLLGQSLWEIAEGIRKDYGEGPFTVMRIDRNPALDEHFSNLDDPDYGVHPQALILADAASLELLPKSDRGNQTLAGDHFVKL